jgi:hypothetical protein
MNQHQKIITLDGIPYAIPHEVAQYVNLLHNYIDYINSEKHGFDSLDQYEKNKELK